MDSKFIVERIEDLQLLKNDSAEIWNGVVKKYPYFSIGQWLNYGYEHCSGKGDLLKLALFKNEPIEFAHFIQEINKMKVKVEHQKVSIAEIIKNDSNVELVEIEDIKILDEGGANIKIEELNLLDELEERRPLEDIVQQTDEAQHEDYLETIRVENEEQQKEDILLLINDLPNTAIFDIPETIAEDEQTFGKNKNDKLLNINDLGDFINNSIESEGEDKSLMVMMSFTDWLKHFKQKTEVEKEEEKERKALKTAWQREKLSQAADEEIDEIPEPIFKQAMESISIESTLISESLAEILANQGKKDKAIAMYKKLSLRNPEKSAYFADLINDLNSNND